MKSTRITIRIETDVLQKLRELALAEKQKKGFLGRVISEAIKNYLKKREQVEIARRQLERMMKGYHMGKLLIKHRDELYDRK
ncbi:MAG TPA: hypothetical protein VJK51_04010 [Candidatus Nanoarchaeia archaeon]|nr:hypothetical protein [Candidatus Nanoarchaeia archaeon]